MIPVIWLDANGHLRFGYRLQSEDYRDGRAKLIDSYGSMAQPTINRVWLSNGMPLVDSNPRDVDSDD